MRVKASGIGFVIHGLDNARRIGDGIPSSLTSTPDSNQSRDPSVFSAGYGDVTGLARASSPPSHGDPDGTRTQVLWR
jgi:hypothetical protein